MPPTSASRRTRVLPVLLVALLLLVAACGDDGDVVADGSKDKDKKATPFEDPTATPSTEAMESAAGKPCVAATEIPPADGKPEVKVPEGPPPTTLVSTDLTVGTGAEAVKDKTVSVQYVGVACSTGKQFDASWDNGKPFEFKLGTGAVIPGWDQGVAGMKVGGRRQLVIPAELAYGAQGSPPAIAPDEPLIFVIDLLEVKDA
jgi:peptidylprolyl isomerase